MRHIYSQTQCNEAFVVPVSLGGFGTTDLESAAEVLDAIKFSELGKANGPALLGQNGNFPTHLLPFTHITDNYVSLYGPKTVPRLGTAVFKITNYDDTTNYYVNVTNGKAYRYADNIAFAAGYDVGGASISINGSVYLIQVTSSIPITPSILTPEQDRIDVEAPLTIQCSDFASPMLGDVHSSSDWQIATDPDYLNVVVNSVKDTINLYQWTVTELPPGSQLYVRVRHVSTKTGASPWSASLRFKTRRARIITPARITAPVSGTSDVNLSFPVTVADYVTEDALDFHVSTDWEVATDVAFSTVVWSKMNSPTDLLATMVTGLEYGRIYYIRARFTGNVVGLGPWSSVVSVRSLNVPTISGPEIIAPPEDGEVTPNPPLVASGAFEVLTGEASHTGTIYEIATDPAFTNVVATLDSDTPVTSWTPPELSYDTTHYVRARYKALSSQ